MPMMWSPMRLARFGSTACTLFSRSWASLLRTRESICCRIWSSSLRARMRRRPVTRARHRRAPAPRPCARPGAAARRQAAGGRRQAAGDRRQAAGGRRQAAGSRQQAAGSRQQAARRPGLVIFALLLCVCGSGLRLPARPRRHPPRRCPPVHEGQLHRRLPRGHGGGGPVAVAVKRHCPRTQNVLLEKARVRVGQRMPLAAAVRAACEAEHAPGGRPTAGPRGGRRGRTAGGRGPACAQPRRGLRTTCHADPRHHRSHQHAKGSRELGGGSVVTAPVPCGRPESHEQCVTSKRDG